jgi:hypothetical protein
LSSKLAKVQSNCYPESSVDLLKISFQDSHSSDESYLLFTENIQNISLFVRTYSSVTKEKFFFL